MAIITILSKLVVGHDTLRMTKRRCYRFMSSNLGRFDISLFSPRGKIIIHDRFVDILRFTIITVTFNRFLI